MAAEDLGRFGQPLPTRDAFEKASLIANELPVVVNSAHYCIRRREGEHLPVYVSLCAKNMRACHSVIERASHLLNSLTKAHEPIVVRNVAYSSAHDAAMSIAASFVHAMQITFEPNWLENSSERDEQLLPYWHVDPAHWFKDRDWEDFDAEDWKALAQQTDCNIDPYDFGWRIEKECSLVLPQLLPAKILPPRKRGLENLSRTEVLRVFAERHKQADGEVPNADVLVELWERAPEEFKNHPSVVREVVTRHSFRNCKKPDRVDYDSIAHLCEPSG